MFLALVVSPASLLPGVHSGGWELGQGEGFGPGLISLGCHVSEQLGKGE